LQAEGFATTTTVITYTYDPLNRLTDATYSNGQRFQYAYDAVGNPAHSRQGKPHRADANDHVHAGDQLRLRCGESLDECERSSLHLG
jgi:YD repeat-containing protein